jgi:hypothetical protein
LLADHIEHVCQEFTLTNARFDSVFDIRMSQRINFRKDG